MVSQPTRTPSPSSPVWSELRVPRMRRTLRYRPPRPMSAAGPPMRPVRAAQDPDYAGSLLLVVSLRITDKLNGTGGNESATLSQTELPEGCVPLHPDRRRRHGQRLRAGDHRRRTCTRLGPRGQAVGLAARPGPDLRLGSQRDRLRKLPADMRQRRRNDVHAPGHLRALIRGVRARTNPGLGTSCCRRCLPGRPPPRRVGSPARGHLRRGASSPRAARRRARATRLRPAAPAARWRARM